MQQMRTGLGLTTVALIMVLALTSTGAQATGGGRIASTCSNETVNGGKYVEVLTFRGELTLRFVLIGSVTCDEAHRLVRAYFGKMAADQQCGKMNSFCELQFAGGWDCFIIPAAQSQDGANADCARTGATIRVYKVSPQASPSLNGPIVITAECGKPLLSPGSLCAGQIGSEARDYTPELDATVGSTNPDHDSMELILIKKQIANYSQTHEWGVAFLPSEVRIINRSKVLIEVKHSLGHRAADGEIDFTFSGGPVHTRTTPAPCGETLHMAYGTITGTIQIKVHDRFFKTITITRMKAEAADSPVAAPCNPPPTPCESPGYSLGGSAPPQSSTHKTEVSVSAAKPPSVSAPLSVIVNEPTAGTPFTDINTLMVLGGTKTFLTLGPNLTSAKLSTPGGVISGGLSVQSYGISTTFPEPCKVGYDQITIQPVHVTTGKVTATFDSIGKVSIGTNSTFSLESVTRVP
jgi:hypothetical protein